GRTGAGPAGRPPPLPADPPKPMLRIGERPILETILLQFKEYGFRRFVIAMHYLGEQIVDYFGDGSRFDAEISYLREPKPLGTAGAPAPPPPPPAGPVFFPQRRFVAPLH